MPFSNLPDVRRELEKLSGDGGSVGANYFLKAFSNQKVQDSFSAFKGKTNLDVSDLAAHGTIVMKFLKDLADGSGDTSVETYIASHKKKSGVNIELIASTQDCLLNAFSEAKMDMGIMETFTKELFSTIKNKW